MDFYKSMDDLKNYFIKFLEKFHPLEKHLFSDDNIKRNHLKLKNKIAIWN